jgi:hypothetical protein
MCPLIAHEHTHGAADHIENIVFGMRVRTRTRGVWLEPPFGNRITRRGFGAIGLEHRVDAAHGIGAPFARPENDGFACRGLRHYQRIVIRR